MLTTCDHPTAHDDNHEVVESVDFPYDEIDRRLTGVFYNGDDGEPDHSLAGQAMARIMEWVWQGGPKNMDGMTIRSTVACWIFIKHLHALNLTQMAAMVNKDKQSLGRWVDEFKKEFPQVKTEHMRT